MKFFIDSANIEEIKELVTTGLVDGVTTNPTLIAQSGRSIKAVIEEICALVQGPVSAEVTATSTEGMLQEGRFLSAIAPQVTVKVPLTIEGLKACKILSEDGVMVNVTLCFTPMQALLAAKAGAAFISPFIGRLDDLAQDGLYLIQEIRTIYDHYPHFSTEILAASIRHPLHVLNAAKIGADVATLPPKIFKQLYNHPLTESGLESFLKDWNKTGQSIL